MSDLRTIKDQMSREVTFSFPPQRIISLVPSQTEFLVDIGASVVGRTKFCIHPKAAAQRIAIIGGTKKFRFEEIHSLKPDLIIGNKEENYRKGIALLEKDYPVWMSDVRTVDDAFLMMKSLAQLCDRGEAAAAIIAACRQALGKVKASRKGKVIYLIWKNPWMAAGKGTFIDHILGHLGYENAVQDERYPSLTEAQIAELNPDYLFFSSEPYPFKEEVLAFAASKWPDIKPEMVDGELFSWYGSRLRRWLNTKA